MLNQNTKAPRHTESESYLRNTPNRDDSDRKTKRLAGAVPASVAVEELSETRCIALQDNGLFAG